MMGEGRFHLPLSAVQAPPTIGRRYIRIRLDKCLIWFYRLQSIDPPEAPRLTKSANVIVSPCRSWIVHSGNAFGSRHREATPAVVDSINEGVVFGALPPISCIFPVINRKGHPLGTSPRPSLRSDDEAFSSRIGRQRCRPEGRHRIHCSARADRPAARIDAYQGPVCNAVQRWAGRNLPSARCNMGDAR